MTQSKMVFALKLIGVWSALLAGTVLGGLLFQSGEPASASDGPLSGIQAFFLVNGVHAVMVGMIASQARVRGLRLGVLIFIAIFGIQTVMMQAETLFLIEFVRIPMDSLTQGIIANMVAALCASSTVAVLWRPTPLALHPIITDLPIRIAVIAVMYAGIYFLAGYFIAWPSDALRAYYDDGLEIDLLSLMAFQIFRGMAWALIALYIAQSLSSAVMRRAIIIGAAFALLGGTQLLYPNAHMPWAVRIPHLMEIGVSNFIFGVMAVRVLFTPRLKLAHWHS